MLNYSTPQHHYLQSSIERFSGKCGHSSLLIDIGCGHSPFLEKFSYDTKVLIDIERRGYVDVVSDVQALSIKDRCADLVILTEVLEHVTDERIALDEIYRILSPTGWFIISTPFMFGMHEKIDYRRWTAQGLRKLLEDHGFKIVEFNYRGGIVSVLLTSWRNIPKDLLGGDFQSRTAKLLYPIIALHFLFCFVLTPFAILFDKFDKNKLSSTGYVILAQKPS